jgi:hypothetical protein
LHYSTECYRRNKKLRDGIALRDCRHQKALALFREQSKLSVMKTRRVGVRSALQTLLLGWLSRWALHPCYSQSEEFNTIKLRAEMGAASDQQKLGPNVLPG